MGGIPATWRDVPVSNPGSRTAILMENFLNFPASLVCLKSGHDDALPHILTSTFCIENRKADDFDVNVGRLSPNLICP